MHRSRTAKSRNVGYNAPANPWVVRFPTENNRGQANAFERPGFVISTLTHKNTDGMGLENDK